MVYNCDIVILRGLVNHLCCDKSEAVKYNEEEGKTDHLQGVMSAERRRVKSRKSEVP